MIHEVETYIQQGEVEVYTNRGNQSDKTAQLNM